MGLGDFLRNARMGAAQALVQIFFVLVVIGAVLGAIFWPLMEFERLSGNEREYWIWVAEWAVADLLLTFFLCRQEIRALFRGRPPS